MNQITHPDSSPDRPSNLSQESSHLPFKHDGGSPYDSDPDPTLAPAHLGTDLDIGYAPYDTIDPASLTATPRGTPTSSLSATPIPSTLDVGFDTNLFFNGLLDPDDAPTSVATPEPGLEYTPPSQERLHHDAHREQLLAQLRQRIRLQQHPAPLHGLPPYHPHPYPHTTPASPAPQPPPAFTDFQQHHPPHGLPTSTYPHPPVVLAPHPPPPCPRAHSQPPEEVTFTRSGHYLGRPLGSRSRRPAGSGSTATAALRKHHHPYSDAGEHERRRRAVRRDGDDGGPRSIPPRAWLPAPGHVRRRRGEGERLESTAEHVGTDALRGGSGTEDGLAPRREWTAGVMAALTTLARSCDEIREVVGLPQSGEDGNGGDVGDVGCARAECRRHNGNVTSLDEPLLILPVSSSTFASAGETGCQRAVAPDIDTRVTESLPTCGRDIRALDTDGIQTVLDVYAIPHLPGMFAFEGKATYLRFVGASDALMHLILD